MLNTAFGVYGSGRVLVITFSSLLKLRFGALIAAYPLVSKGPFVGVMRAAPAWAGAFMALGCRT